MTENIWRLNQMPATNEAALREQKEREERERARALEKERERLEFLDNRLTELKKLEADAKNRCAELDKLAREKLQQGDNAQCRDYLEKSARLADSIKYVNDRLNENREATARSISRLEAENAVTEREAEIKRLAEEQRIVEQQQLELKRFKELLDKVNAAVAVIAFAFPQEATTAFLVVTTQLTHWATDTFKRG
jgi:hypothetical protein